MSGRPEPFRLTSGPIGPLRKDAMKLSPNPRSGHLPPKASPPSRIPERAAGPAQVTLKQACAQLVADTAGALIWKRYTASGRKPDPAEARTQLWQSPEGKALAALSRCRWAGKPKSEALAAIAADKDAAARYAEGLRVLRQGFGLPA